METLTDLQVGYINEVENIIRGIKLLEIRLLEDGIDHPPDELISCLEKLKKSIGEMYE